MILLTSALSCANAEETQSGGWSADLLKQILHSEKGTADATDAAATSEMVLRTYPLAHIKIAEAGKSQTVLAILRKMLPAGSSLNTDVPANSVHLLTTPSAHAAAWEYLSALDTSEAPPTTAPVPEDVKVALKKLAESGDKSGRLLEAIDSLSSEVSREFGEIDARQRRQTFKLLAVVLAVSIVLIATVSWMLHRRPAAGAQTPASANAQILAPEQLTSALTPVHDKMRSDMLGLLNEVAIRLQAQHNEQQKLVLEQQKQLEDARLALADERRQLITEAGSMVVQAVERVDATTAKLARQQDKVAELVQELQNTVRELDDTKDNLRDREIELEQERAKIAALSMLLEEGGALPPPDADPHAFRRNGNGHSVNGTSPDPQVGSPAANIINRTETSSCTTPDALQTLRTQPPEPMRPNTPRFQFLPPDHPET